MSSIHRTRSGSHEVKYREGRRQRSKTFKRKADAQVFKVDVDRRLASGRPIRRRQDTPTLREFAVEWLASKRNLSASTRALYARLLADHVFDELGHLPLLDLRPRRLAEWQRQRLDAGAGPAVLGKAQGVLHQILQLAVLPHEYLDYNPVAALPRPEYERKTHRWLTASEVEQLRRWFLEREDPGAATLISVLAYVGIRPQDALALRAEDVGERLRVERKVSEGEILEGSKTGLHQRRSVTIPGPVADDLAGWISTGLIFPRARDGKPWRKTDWDNWRGRRFKLAAEEVGLGRSLKPYDLRHTAATLFAAAGWDHIEIAHQLGHSPEESQRTYQHLLERHQGAERRSVDEWILQARGEGLREASSR